MKIKSILTATVATMMFACAEKAPQGYQITGDIVGITGKVYLTVYEGKQPVRIDSTEAVNGAFTFNGNLALPMFAAIETPEATVKNFFVENSPISITGSMEDVRGINVIGSLTNDTYSNYQTRFDSIQKAVRNDSLAKADPQLMDAKMNDVAAQRLQFVKENPTSIAAAYILYRELSYTMDFEQLQAAVGGFDPSVNESVYIKLVGSMAEALQKTAVGQQYTDFSTPDKDGNMVALSSVVGPGKYVLLDFWASWCPPCRAEAPFLVEAYKQYAPKGFEIFAVSLDKTKEDWLKGISDMKLDWKHVSELQFWTNKGIDIYGVRSIPSSVLIGPDGVIIARNLRGEELKSKLAELIK